jgi:hypothetical protein
MYEGVTISFRTHCLERELQIVQLSATRCCCIAILWVSLVSFATITLCVAQQVFVVVDFIINSVHKLFDTPSCITSAVYQTKCVKIHFSRRHIFYKSTICYSAYLSGFDSHMLQIQLYFCNTNHNINVIAHCTVRNYSSLYFIKHSSYQNMSHVKVEVLIESYICHAPIFGMIRHFF